MRIEEAEIERAIAERKSLLDGVPADVREMSFDAARTLLRSPPSLVPPVEFKESQTNAGRVTVDLWQEAYDNTTADLAERLSPHVPVQLGQNFAAIVFDDLKLKELGRVIADRPARAEREKAEALLEAGRRRPVADRVAELEAIVAKLLQAKEGSA